MSSRTGKLLWKKQNRAKLLLSGSSNTSIFNGRVENASFTAADAGAGLFRKPNKIAFVFAAPQMAGMHGGSYP